MSKVIAEYVSRAVKPGPPPAGSRIRIDPVTGLKVLDLGRIITAEDVRQATDDE